MPLKKLFRLVLRADEEMSLFRYQELTKADLERGDLTAVEFRGDEIGDSRNHQFVIETFNWDILKQYRELARKDSNLSKVQIRIRTFRAGEM